MNHKYFSISTRVCIFLLKRIMSGRRQTITLTNQYVGPVGQITPGLAPVRVKSRGGNSGV